MEPRPASLYSSVMDRNAGHNSAYRHLYPAISPFDQRMIEMPGGHTIYVEQCGNPSGIPAVVLHGGPGGGCSPAMRRYFDPERYRVVLFDQRGCGRSRPFASVENNTTQDLIADIERIRTTLGIDRWVVFGGSWGATLSLLYAQAHPEQAAYLVLRGVFLMTRRELAWFYGGGAARFFPDMWRRFTELIPAEEQDDLIAAYRRRLFCGDLMEETRHAQRWAGWENALASMESHAHLGEGSGSYARAFARIENHYFSNAGFLSRDGQILAEMPEIAHIPGTVVQGRYDMICPPEAANALCDAWPRGALRMVPNAGHALSEPGISAELVRALRSVAKAPELFGF